MNYESIKKTEKYNLSYLIPAFMFVAWSAFLPPHLEIAKQES